MIILEAVQPRDGIVALLAAASTVVLCGWTIARLAHTPEPRATSGGWTKPTYRSIVTWNFVLAAAGTALATALLAAASVPASRLVPWLAVAGVGAVAGLADLRTTYLPNTLMRPLLILVAAGSAIGVGVEISLHGLAAGTRIAVSLAIATAVSHVAFRLVWSLGRQVGYGDVRLATALAAPLALVSWATWFAGLLLGTLVGAVWALVIALRRRRVPSPLGAAFPYGPSLLAGAWLALAAA